MSLWPAVNNSLVMEFIWRGVIICKIFEQKSTYSKEIIVFCEYYKWMIQRQKMPKSDFQSIFPMLRIIWVFPFFLQLWLIVPENLFERLVFKSRLWWCEYNKYDPPSNNFITNLTIVHSGWTGAGNVLSKL